MKKAIINCIDSHIGDLQSCSNDEEVVGVLSDIINNMYYYMAKLVDKPTSLKIGDRYIEYITSNTIGVTDYRKASQQFDKKIARELLNSLVVDVNM